MTKQEAFIQYIDKLIENYGSDMPDDAKEFYELFKTQGLKIDRPILTESGIKILEYIQQYEIGHHFKSKDIADGMGISSRKVSGSMTKLASDGFVDKFGSNPIVYTLTEKGKSFDISSLKEQ